VRNYSSVENTCGPNGCFDNMQGPVVVGDLNGDGKADLIIPGSLGNTVSALLGNGDGTFKTATNYTVGTNPLSIAIGDFNGDGKVDLAVADSYGVSVLSGNGDGTFQSATNYVTGFGGGFSVAVGAFKGDGRASLAVTPSGNGVGLTVLLGGAPTPDLTISKTHAGNFTQGQTGATYTITISNIGRAATSGTITAVDNLPAALMVAGISGTGWSCVMATVTCTRADALASSASYPAITVTVNVAANASVSVTNTATVSGGGETNTANDTASDLTRINVAEINQTITFTSLSYQTLGSAPFVITATASSGLVVNLISLTNTVCTLSGTTVTLVTIGTCSITATQGGNAQYAAATPVTVSFAVKYPQTIAFEVLSNIKQVSPPFTVSAIASSGLTVTFASTTPGVCTVAGTNVTSVAAGVCSITATQTGSSTYAAAPPATQSFTILGPIITAGGIGPLSTSSPTIQPGSWVNIYGTDLANTTATWNNDFPTLLGGVTVTINGKKAYLLYVSPTQIDLQAPDDTTTGNVNVTVTNADGSWTSSEALAPISPSFSLLDGKHVAGIILRYDGSGAYGNGAYDILGPTGASLGYPTVAAKAGDIVELYGVGFGPANPPVSAGQPIPGGEATTNALQLAIGGTTVTPLFSGLSSFASLFQINVTIPAGLGTGDQPLLGLIGGVQTQSGIVISLQ